MLVNYQDSLIAIVLMRVTSMHQAVIHRDFSSHVLLIHKCTVRS